MLEEDTYGPHVYPKVSKRNLVAMKEQRKRVRKSLAHSEIQNVINALRRYGNWQKAETKFTEVRNLLAVADLNQLDSVQFFDPFLHVINSKKSSWYLTKVSLASINRLLKENFIDMNTPQCKEGINLIVSTILRSKFANLSRRGSENEELVEIYILKVVLSSLRSAVGSLINEDLVFESIQICLALATQERTTDLFQDTAEKILKAMVENVCFKTLEIQSKGNWVEISPNSSEESLTITEDDASVQSPSYHNINLVHKVLKFLCALLKREKRADQQAEHHQLLALGLLNNLIVKHIYNIRNFPPLILDLIKDDLCKQMIEALKTTKLLIFTRVLRMFFNLFVALKEQLKLQMELFFTTIITQLLENKKAPASHRDVALEIFLEFCNDPYFIIELYINYDCDPLCSNVLDSLCKYLCKNASPVNGTLSNHHLLALSALQSILRCIATCCIPSPDLPSLKGSTPPASPSATPLHRKPAPPFRPQEVTATIESPPETTEVTIDPKRAAELLNYVVKSDTLPETLHELKKVKELMTIGVQKFNEKPKVGLKFLQESGLIQTPLNAPNVTQFMRNTPGLNKTTLGTYLGERDEFNIEVLKTFITAFVDEYHTDKQSALTSTVRAFLESFRPPGDANVISRILENFSNIYFEYHKRTEDNASFPIANPDILYILCFSIVMLNVDLHSPNIKNKMTVEQFVSRCQMADDSKSLSKELLENIYNSIAANEIKIPEENPDDDLNDNTWKSLVRRSKRTKFAEIKEQCPVVVACNQDIFNLIWKPVISSFAVVFDSTTSKEIIDKTVNGFHSCALISAYYNLSQVYDFLVISMCNFSTLAQLSAFNPEQGVNLTVDNVKMHIELQTLFDTILNYSSHLREGWKNILDCLVALHRVKLLPNLVDIENFFIDFVPQVQEPAKQETSFIGYILDYSTWFSVTPEKETHVEAIDEDDIPKTKDIIQSSNIIKVIQDSKTIHPDSLVHLVKATIAASQKVPKGGQATTLYMDLLTNIALLNKDRINLLWVMIHEYFSSLISTAQGNLREKAISNFLLLCNSLLYMPEVADKVLSSLDTILSELRVNTKLSSHFEEKLSFGISKILKSNAPYIRTADSWRILFGMLEYTTHKASANIRLKSIQLLIPNEEHQNLYISKANFAMCLHTLKTYVDQADHKVAIQALELMLTLFSLVDNIVGFRKDTQALEQAWKEYWIPIFKMFAGYWKDKRTPVREFAVEIQRRAVVNSSLSELTGSHWSEFFDKILLPLLADLVNPKDPQLCLIEPLKLETLRQHGVYLLSKTFLHYLPIVSQLPREEFKDLWLKILGTFKVYFNEGTENLRESLKELLKNILLVMSVLEVFNKEDDFWKLSMQNISEFCPSIMDDQEPPQEVHTPTNNPPEQPPAPVQEEVPKVQELPTESTPSETLAIDIPLSPVVASPLLSTGEREHVDSPASVPGTPPTDRFYSSTLFI